MEVIKALILYICAPIGLAVILLAVVGAVFYLSDKISGFCNSRKFSTKYERVSAVVIVREEHNVVISVFDNYKAASRCYLDLPKYEDELYRTIDTGMPVYRKFIAMDEKEVLK